MLCVKCSEQLGENDIFCKNCGQKQEVVIPSSKKLSLYFSHIIVGILVGIFWFILLFSLLSYQFNYSHTGGAHNLKELLLNVTATWVVLFLPLVIGIIIGRFFSAKGNVGLIFFLPLALAFIVFIGIEIFSCLLGKGEVAGWTCIAIAPFSFAISVPIYLGTSFVVNLFSTRLAKRKTQMVTGGIFVVLLALVGWVIVSYQGDQEQQIREQNFYNLALQKNDILLCTEIEGSNVDQLREKCIRDVAMQLKDGSLCERYFSQRNERDKGWRDLCFSGVAKASLDIQFCDRAGERRNLCMGDLDDIAIKTKDKQLCEALKKEGTSYTCIHETFMASKLSVDEFENALLFTTGPIELKPYLSKKSTELLANQQNPIMIEANFNHLSKPMEGQNLIIRADLTGSKNINEFVFIKEEGEWRLDIVSTLQRNKENSELNMENWRNYK